MSAPRSRLAMLLAALALPMAACGESDEGLLSDRQASRLSAALEDTRRAVDDERCQAARSAARRGADLASELPNRVDTELQRNLQDGFNHLVDQVNVECSRDRTADETPEPTSTPDETAEPTSTPDETAEPTPSPTETAEPTSTPTTTPPPTITPDTGGAPGDEGADESAGRDPIRAIGQQGKDG